MSVDRLSDICVDENKNQDVEPGKEVTELLQTQNQIQALYNKVESLTITSSLCKIDKEIIQFKNKISDLKKTYQNTVYIQKINYLENRLVKTVEMYYKKISLYKRKIKDDQRRTIKILDVDHKLTDDQINEYVENSNSQTIIKKMKSFLVEDTVLDIERRHVDILQLESSIQEIYELFKDLSVLVDLQQESLDVIQVNIEKAYMSVSKGEVDIQSAEDYQNKSRNKRCCLLLIVLGILCAVLTPTILSSTKGF